MFIRNFVDLLSILTVISRVFTKRWPYRMNTLDTTIDLSKEMTVV